MRELCGRFTLVEDASLLALCPTKRVMDIEMAICLDCWDAIEGDVVPAAIPAFAVNGTISCVYPKDRKHHVVWRDAGAHDLRTMRCPCTTAVRQRIFHFHQIVGSAPSS